MKKIAALLIVGIMSLSLVACGGVDKPSNAEKEQGSNNEQLITQSTDNSDTSNQQSSDKLVINDGSKLGVLQPVAEQQDFVINGLYISTESRQHDYMHVDEVDTFGIDGLNSEFELNEWIGFYLDTEYKSPMNIYFVRNDAEADYAKITIQELESICSDKEYPVLSDVLPDGENRGFAGQTYVNPESSQPDLFNVFFTANGKVCYMVQVNLIAERTAE